MSGQRSCVARAGRNAAFVWLAITLGAAGAAQQTTSPAPDAAKTQTSQQTPTQAPSSAAPQAPAATKPRSTAEDNPFPEDVSKKAAAAAAEDEKADRAAAASGAASDDENSSSSREKFGNLDLLGDRDPRISDGAGHVVRNDKLADEDLRVGILYIETGDYVGAYGRLKEAVTVDPANAEAVFRLGEAAQKLNKRDEALADYETYLTALPDGPRAKAIRKALKELAKR